MKITTTRSVISHVKACVYGESGVGKTLLGASAPRPIILSAERGLLSLADRDQPVIEISSLKEAKEAIAFLKDNKDYDTIVVDSISELAEVLLVDFKKYEKDPRQAYGKMADELFLFTRAIRDLPKHIVFIAKEEVYKDEFTGKVCYRPSTPGQSYTGSLPYLFDEVLALRVKRSGEKVTRFLQTQPDSQYSAKDRSGKLDAKEELGDKDIPNLTNIFNKIIGK